ncbi:uncharacterized protein LOC132974291 isoform X2 [Labrus mixtus]|uniref:uncharacterized protein LOC132974291 isoform X2 n=1 Tax=Labrus mixtus TaxID=508554 RepID=UPI0029BFB18D|nr:uncharacterized protein LOC132974291 isoform X2 [Labrus mixtus]
MDHKKHLTPFKETRTGPVQSPGPESPFKAVLSVEDQILSTIDTSALLTATSPDDDEEEAEQKEEGEEDEDGEEDDDAEEEKDKGLRVCEMKMKSHHELKNRSSCVLLERQRRKRITQGCRTLQNMLPIIHGSGVDMVTVLEKTVAFLEMVQELVPAEDSNVQLCPPAELCADWLLQSRESKEVSHKMATEQKKEKKLNRSGGVLLQQKRSRRWAHRKPSIFNDFILLFSRLHWFQKSMC